MSHAGEPRIALLHHGFGAPGSDSWSEAVGELAQRLSERRHRVAVITAARIGTERPRAAGVDVRCAWRLPEEPLRFRGFPTPLTHIPGALLALRSFRPELCHAFSPIDTTVALAWRRRSAAPVVFTMAEPVERANLADRRGRLRGVERAFAKSDAAYAGSRTASDAAHRWLSLDLPVLATDDVEATAKVYDQMLRCGTSRL